MHDFDSGTLEENSMWSYKTDTNYYIDCYFEYFEEDLQKQLIERQISQKSFTESQLLDLCNQMINANYLLQSNNMKHGDIRPCFIMQDVNLKKGAWKLTENLRDKAERGQKLAFEAGTKIYVSPLAYKNLFDLQEQYEHDLHKSDVFSFGLCLLEAGLLKNIQDIYDSNHMELNEQI